MLRVRSSRRAATLKPTDYDHEIVIIDHDGARAGRSADDREAGMERVSTETRLLTPLGEEHEDDQLSSHLSARTDDQDQNVRVQERPADELEHEQELPHVALQPSIEVQEPTPQPFHESPHVVPRKPRVERETVIDILYENERGGFLCGRALFSSAALGGLDPPAWTNAYHKPSPTSIHTAQVPDPSWEWLWSDWHLNQQDGVDEGGWEYAFAFGKKFSWHKPRWYNSFVRRRAWTRKRGRKREEDMSVDHHMLNGDYFMINPSSTRTSRHSQRSLASSRIPSKASLGQTSSVEVEQAKPDIIDLETLLQVLRSARIDREKLEATENYLENAVDLSQLHEEMHEIMALFVFQASRRLLLGHLMTIYEDVEAELEKKETLDLLGRRQALQDALRHADEEVRKLAYWSDVKQMAESGESRGAVDCDKGWQNEWEGVDQSGPSMPNKGKLPET